VNVLVLTLFVSLCLAAVAVALFVWTVRAGTHDHLDQLSLLPIEEDPSEEEP